MRAVVVMVGSLSLLAACSDKRADAGLVGADQLISITRSGPASLEPFFSSKVTIDGSGHATLSVENAKGHLPIKMVKASRSSFENVAFELADFRPAQGNVQSECRGYSDAGPVTISWHYASGREDSYSAQPGCRLRHE
jgi:hypothetical protein